jgi:hypothetical protein
MYGIFLFGERSTRFSIWFFFVIIVPMTLAITSCHRFIFNACDFRQRTQLERDIRALVDAEMQKQQLAAEGGVDAIR